MSTRAYCWRCKAEVPMLDESEWQDIAPLLRDGVGQIKSYRSQHGVGLREAREKGFGQAALARYVELTGYPETSADALFHHRLSLFGGPCRACGKLLRTPRAKFCAECGVTIEHEEMNGSLRQK